MKKTVLTLAFLFAAVLTAAAQEMPWFMPKVDASQYKGKVKEVQYRYIEMRDEEELQDTDYYFYTYSREGRLLTKYINNVDGLCHISYHWSTHLDSVVYDGDCASSEIFRYDADGRLVSVISKTGHPDTAFIVYDSRGFPVKTEGNYDSRWNEPWYEWYDDGRIKGIGSKHWGDHYEYDDLGRLVKETNEKNRVVTYTYNKHGDVETVTSDPKGNKYYNNGKVSTSRYKYKYDSHGNWTKKYSGRTLLVVRKITYYD